MFCRKCGKKLDDGQKFCDNCGEAIIAKDVQASNNNKEADIIDPTLHNKVDNTINTALDNKEVNNTYGIEKKYKTRNTIIIIASIIVSLSLIGITGYIILDKYSDKFNKANNKISEEVVVDDTSAEKEEIKEDTVKEDKEINEDIPDEENNKVKWELDKDRLEKSPRLKKDYVISDSNSRNITFSELNDYTIDELFVARNELLARYGYSFNGKENLKKYFQSKSWYNENPDFDGTLPSDIEKVNYEMLASIEYLKKAYEVSGDLNGDYVLPTSNIMVQYEENIRRLTNWELIIARNEIYARYGLNFSTKEIKDHFLRKSWFKINDEVGNDLALTETENKNLQLILTEEKKRMSIAFDHDL